MHQVAHEVEQGLRLPLVDDIGQLDVGDETLPDGGHPDNLLGWLPCHEYKSSDIPVINPLWEFYYPQKYQQQYLTYKMGDIVYNKAYGVIDKIKSFLVWEDFGYEVELERTGTFWFAAIRPATADDGEYIEEDNQ